MDIVGKVVVITGAGSGLGQALSICFLLAGAKVVGIGRSENKLRQTAELAESNQFCWRVADVAEALEFSEALDWTINEFGAIDVLINNAAVYPRVPFLDQSADEWMKVIAINLGGPANGCRLVLPHMLRRKTGRIINISSFAGENPIPESSAYAVSKIGLRALTKALANEIDRSIYPDVLVNELIPGALKTQMNDYQGQSPSVCCRWALDLATLPSGGPSGETFDKGEQLVVARGIRQRIKDRLLFWR